MTKVLSNVCRRKCNPCHDADTLLKAKGGPTKYYDICFVNAYMFILFKNSVLFLHIKLCLTTVISAYCMNI
jgi:hypothetical protein